jgi:hypothetical protein
MYRRAGIVYPIGEAYTAPFEDMFNKGLSVA